MDAVAQCDSRGLHKPYIPPVLCGGREILKWNGSRLEIMWLTGRTEAWLRSTQQNNRWLGTDSVLVPLLFKDHLFTANQHTQMKGAAVKKNARFIFSFWWVVFIAEGEIWFLSWRSGNQANWNPWCFICDYILAQTLSMLRNLKC